ncbi:hypothetical protein AB833_21920 [Chromatiales bacterium (ex Bugula neritina AB1)]|nr:hypothetical protein AB833_21920 [Chromatiales bacterium (ex Bugula neritina AB1)]
MAILSDTTIGSYLVNNPQIARADDPPAVNSVDKARDTAEKFEALLLQTMLKAMRKTMPGNDLFGSDQADMYMDMFDQELSADISKSKSLGIADTIYRQLAPQESREVGRANSLTGPMTNAVNSSSQSVRSGLPIPQEAFINRIVGHARSAAEALGTKAEAVLALAALETGWGSRVPQRDNGSSTHNLFGIKADQGWNGDSSQAKTSEFQNGEWTTQSAEFRAYDSEQRSIQDFADFILRNPRYGAALENAENPESFIREVHKAGYATDPAYADKAISIMDRITNSADLGI